MSEKENNDFKNFYNENPFKKRIILEKVNKPGPVEQKLIIHHKKNLRKVVFFSLFILFFCFYNQLFVLCKNAFQYFKWELS